ncbi:MAG TPA: response regulator transcription factor [Acidimicrobiales bacterium]
MLDGSCGSAGWRPDRQFQVLIVDDHVLQRVGMRHVLETTKDIVVVGETGEGNAVGAMVGKFHPDIVLIDIRLPDRSGIDVAREIARHDRGIRVVILSAYDDDHLVRGAFRAGVAGYLLKTMPPGELISAVRAAGEGMTVLDPAVSERWDDMIRSPPSSTSALLTLRERQIVALVGEGLSNRAIATHLGLSVRTVEGHMSRVFAKVGLATRTELVRLALADDLAQSGSSELD